MSGIPRRAIEDGAVSPNKLSRAVYGWTRFLALGHELPAQITYNNVTDWDPPDPTVDTYQTVLFRNGPVTARFMAAGTDPLQKGNSGEALQLVNTTTTDSGYEYAWASFPEIVSGHDASEPFVYTVGLSKPLMIRFKGKNSTVSAVQCRVGFRKGQAGPGAFDDMTDAAVLNMLDGDVLVSTILNDAATSDVDTGLDVADGVEFEFKVVLGVAGGPGNQPSAGVARFFYDGVEVGAPFTFDSGDEIFPVLWGLDDGGGGSGDRLILTELEVAYLADIDDHYVL